MNNFPDWLEKMCEPDHRDATQGKAKSPPEKTASRQPLLLSEPEAAKYLGVCQKTLATMRKAGKIAFVPVGERCVRYSTAELKAFVVRNTIKRKEVS